MLRYLKKLFTQRCPECDKDLQSKLTELSCLKFCPDGHYEEENYFHLGVRVINTRNDEIR
jgi:hypothetical protein